MNVIVREIEENCECEMLGDQLFQHPDLILLNKLKEGNRILENVKIIKPSNNLINEFKKKLHII